MTLFDLTANLGPAARYVYLRGRLDHGTELRLAARQFALAWVNGIYVGRTYERTHEEELRYRTFDLEPHVGVGDNVITVLAHHWGDAAPGRFLVAVGGVEAEWEGAVAEEFRPARRHNSLLGHEELRDLRRTDRVWTKLTPCLKPGLRCLPSPLRPLCEEEIVPTRILQQGKLRRGLFGICRRPEKAREWTMTLALPAAQALNFLLPAAVGDRLWVDDREVALPVEPPFDWVHPIHSIPLPLAAGRHVLRGVVIRGDLRYGWRGIVPVGGDRTSWGQAEPDPEHAPVAYEIGAEGDETAVLYELPFNGTILPRIEVADAPAGGRIELAYAERVSRQPGLLLPAAYTDRAILREGAQCWEVAFQYKSAGVLMVIHDPAVKVKKVSAIYRHYDYEKPGRWQSSDARLDRIWEISRHTVEMGSQDFIVDGPWREQLLYIGDIFVSHHAAYHLFSNAHEIAEWTHRQFAQGQRADGLFSPNQPGRPAPEHDRLLDQVVLWPLELEQHRLYTGREAFVREMAPHVDRLLEGFHARFGGGDDPRLRGLTGWNWVDHPGLEDGVPRRIRHDGIPTAINLLYLMALRTVPRYAGRAAQLAERLRREHWHPGRQAFADCVVAGQPCQDVSLHVNLLAMEAGLADDPAGLLARTWKQPGVLQISGAYFRYHLLEVLHRLGRHQELLDEIRDWWGLMVDQGLTSLAENQFQNGDWGASVGHPWGASPCIHLVRSIAGVTPLEPGWRRIRCAPQLADLTFLNVAVATPFGRIQARFARPVKGEEIEGVLEIPKGIEVERGLHAGQIEVRETGG